MNATARQWAKMSLQRLAPKLALVLQSVRSRRLSHRLVREWGLVQIADRLVAHSGLTVIGGPFEGMRLPAAARAEHLAPYLLGTYESELHPWLAGLRCLSFDTVLDVGAKFGYYALGLAQWFPRARVVAWDTDPWARRAMREGARLNEIENLQVRGYLAPGALAEFVQGATFVISDCEGFEGKLFGNADLERLASAWMIIEIHEESAPGVAALLRRRFEASHTIEAVAKAPRRPSPEVVALLGNADAVRAVTEARSEQTWMFLRPLRALGERGCPQG